MSSSILCVLGIVSLITLFVFLGAAMVSRTGTVTAHVATSILFISFSVFGLVSSFLCAGYSLADLCSPVVL